MGVHLYYYSNSIGYLLQHIARVTKTQLRLTRHHDEYQDLTF